MKSFNLLFVFARGVDKEGRDINGHVSPVANFSSKFSTNTKVILWLKSSISEFYQISESVRITQR